MSETNDESLYVNAEEAAALLGVSVTTVYAYVGRKRVRSHKVAGTRNRRYWREDIIRLKRGQPTTHDSGAAGTLVSGSAITLITPDGPYYRGQSAIALAKTSTLEDVAALLWNVDRNLVFSEALPKSPAIGAAMDSALAGLSPLDRAITLFPFIERENPRAYDLTPISFARTGADIVRWFAAFIANAPAPSCAPVHEYLIGALGQPKPFEKIVTAVTILSADHELDPTTYAVRAVANSGTSPYKIVMAGLATSTGRRLAFGRHEALARMINEICGADPEAAVVRRVREGEALPGFGSPMYASGDPRALALLEIMRDILGDDVELRSLLSAARIVADITGQRPDFAMVSAFAGRKIGLAGAEGMLFRLGRLVGWIAHAKEQFEGGELVRPRTVYTGPLPDIGPQRLPR